jgi:tRNA nucleotidyltransferase (CCA-adding enzyme)
MANQLHALGTAPDVRAAPADLMEMITESEPLTWPTRIVCLGQARNSSDSQILELELDDDEIQLFESLTKAAKAAKALEEGSLASDKYTSKPVQIRVVGGWVRDKLLGLTTHDVDVALDTCTGVQFAHIVKDYITDFEETNDQKKCGRTGVIAANPAQSKHLETATMKIHRIEVDFSNLRHETYADDSRIPTTVIGTPIEDSYRRDFTMNALYYNLQTQQVEDWTRRGLRDLLETKIVVTPLEAYQTFHDDPLRVLRAIRFAVRFDMKLAENLKKASMDAQIHQELHRKVSRERVGKELEGMLSGKHANPQKALQMICDLHLAGGVFCVPPPSVPTRGTIGQARLEQVPYLRGNNPEDLAQLRQLAWEEARQCLFVLPRLLKQFPQPKEGDTTIDRRLVFLATVLLPYEHLQYEDKNKVKYVAEYMMRDGIKFKNKDAQGIVSLTHHLDDMVQLLLRRPEASPSVRLQAGLLLRNTKELWVTLLTVATVALVRRKGEDMSMDWGARANEWYTTIMDGLELDGCWTMRPLMNGKELMEKLGLDKGPEVGIYNQEQLHWMLMNPSGTLQDCITFLKTFQKQREFEEDQAAQHISKKMHL